MATAVVLTEVDVMKREAKAHWNWVTQSGAVINTNSLRIGYHAAILKRKGQFGILGFASESEAQAASGVGASTWYSVIAIAERFPDVDEDLFVSMKLTNAKALGDLPESQRLSKEWMTKARCEPIAAFAQAVDEAMDGRAKPSDGKEKIHTFKQPMPASAKKNVEDGIKQYAEENNLEPDQALPIMVAEFQQAPSLLTAMTHAINKLGIIQKLIEESEWSADRILENVEECITSVVAEFNVAIQAVKQSQNTEG